MIKINNLHKNFGKLTVLHNLDLTIKEGGIFAVLGPNGSGKTTLIKSILGMVIPDKGEIIFDNQSVLKKSEYRNKISYLPQIANFPNNLTVIELINLVKNLRNQDSREQELIDLFALKPFLAKKLDTLSGGTKQKVNIVLSFMFDSKLLILDEPTTGLDPLSLVHLKKIIKDEHQKGKTILITTHIMSFVEELAEEIVFLLDGKVYFKGTLKQIQEQTQQNSLEKAIATILETEHV